MCVCVGVRKCACACMSVGEVGGGCACAGEGVHMCLYVLFFSLVLTPSMKAYLCQKHMIVRISAVW